MALTLFVRKVFNFLYVCAIWVTKGTDTTVQVRMYWKAFGFAVHLSPPSHFVNGGAMVTSGSVGHYQLVLI